MDVEPRPKRSWIVRLWSSLFGRRVEYVYVNEPVRMETFEPEPPPNPVANLWLFLESRDAGFHFEAKVAVDYRLVVTNGTGLPADPMRMAKLAVQDRARAVAAGVSMSQYDQFRGRLHRALLNEVRVEGSEVVAWAQVLGVRVDKEDAELFAKRERVMRQARLTRWRYEARQWEIDHLARLLADPRRATAAWLSDHPEERGQLPEIVELFIRIRDRLSSDAGTPGMEDLDAVPFDSWGRILDDFQVRAEDPDRSHLGASMIKFLRARGLKDLADRLHDLSEPIEPSPAPDTHAPAEH